MILSGVPEGLSGTPAGPPEPGRFGGGGSEAKGITVCMLTTGFPRFEGDLYGNFVLALARELIAQGVALEVVAPHAVGLPRAEALEGVPVRRFRYFLPGRWQRLAYGGGIPTNLKESWVSRLQVPLFLLGFWLEALWSGRKCSLFHCHWTISGLVAYGAARLRRRPVVLTVRGSDLHLMQKGLIGWVNRRTYRWMDRIIAVSEDIAGRLREAGVGPDKIRVVYNGVDPRFHPRDPVDMRRRLGLPEGRFIVVFVGLIVPVKGVDVLVRALQLLDDERLLCVLVGGGPLSDELQEESERAGMADRVLFCGAQPTADIPLWLNAADVLVLPSRSEGRPNVVLEAQACGVPVVATRVGGTPELIRDGETGLLVESGDAPALAAGLLRLMDDEACRRRLGRAGREAILASDLTWEASARRVGEIYREVLEGR